MSQKVELVECPRDAMQGLSWYIPAETKIRYLNSLLKVGFDTLDFGSFVSPKAIPQMRDTAEVLKALDLNGTDTKLLAIIANLRGGQDALAFDEISFLGFPFSISETFQQRNTNSSISESLETVSQLQNLCQQKGKELVVYISMAFGNPYGDPWHPDIAVNWVEKIAAMGIKTIAMADTVGVAVPEDITKLFSSVIPSFKDVRFGAHLHCTPDSWKPKLNAAWEAGCRRFDSAMKGYGGCPMAKDELTGNLATENLVFFLDEKNVNLTIDRQKMAEVLLEASGVFASPIAT